MHVPFSILPVDLNNSGHLAIGKGFYVEQNRGKLDLQCLDAII